VYRDHPFTKILLLIVLSIPSYSTSGNYLNKNAVALAPRRNKTTKRILLSRQQARYEEPLPIKPAYTYAQVHIAGTLVSHSGQIIHDFSI
jgi:hypothetical protein